MIDLLAGLGSVFIPQPWLALIPAVLFAIFFRLRRRRIVGVAAGAWLAYALWEYALYRRWLCSGECNIRIDLLLVYPVLLIVSLTAIVVGIKALLDRQAAART